MVKVYYFTPYSLEKNIGKAYNEHMELLPTDDSWGCLMDADIMLFGDFGHQVVEVINKVPNAGLITCATNRCGHTEQRIWGLMEDRDLAVLKEKADGLRIGNFGKIKEIKPIIGDVSPMRVSGYFMLVRKDIWQAVGRFDESGKLGASGLLGVDWEFAKRVHFNGLKVYLMLGLFAVHYYRLKEGRQYKDHLL